MKCMKLAGPRWRAVWALGLVLVVAASATAVTVATHGHSFARAAGGTDQAAPTWLQSLVDVVGEGYATTPVEAAQYTLTTNGSLHEALPDLGTVDPSLAAKEMYFVVLEGAFESTRHPIGSKPPSGRILVLAIDADTQSVSMLGIVHEMPNLAVLGDMSPLAVSAATTK